MGQGSQQGFGGGGGMGQYGMGPRSVMGNNSQFQGNTGQMGGGKGHGHDQLTIDIVCLLISIKIHESGESVIRTLSEKLNLFPGFCSD